MYICEVWTGDGWLTLGVYASERSARRRMASGKPACGYGAQERRVRKCRDGEAERYRANMKTLSRRERAEMRRVWG